LRVDFETKELITKL